MDNTRSINEPEDESIKEAVDLLTNEKTKHIVQSMVDKQLSLMSKEERLTYILHTASSMGVSLSELLVSVFAYTEYAYLNGQEDKDSINHLLEICEKSKSELLNTMSKKITNKE